MQGTPAGQCGSQGLAAFWVRSVRVFTHHSCFGLPPPSKGLPEPVRILNLWNVLFLNTHTHTHGFAQSEMIPRECQSKLQSEVTGEIDRHVQKEGLRMGRSEGCVQHSIEEESPT